MNGGYARCAVAQSLQLSLPQKLAIADDWLMMRSWRPGCGRAHLGVADDEANCEVDAGGVPGRSSRLLVC